MNRQKTIIISGVISLLLIVGALVFVMQSGQDTDESDGSKQSNGQPQSSQNANATISTTGLAQNDGKNGNNCWVAVDGTVYEIPSDSPLWQNGQHSESEGQAFCGQDMSEVIKLSPHGKTKLTTLDKVGTFSP